MKQTSKTKTVCNRTIVSSVLLLLAASCVTQPKFEIVSDYDPGTSFSGYKTFAWMTSNPLFVSSMQPVNPQFEPSLMRETSAQLESRGFRRVAKPADADVVISFTAGSRDNLQVNNYPSKYRQMGTVGKVYAQNSEVREITTGAFAIEIFDQQSGQRIWTGWAATGLTMDVRVDAATVSREMVQLILADFPPGYSR